MKNRCITNKKISKKAAATIGTAIKVITSIVLGAALLVGTYSVVKANVIPTAERKVSSMFEVTDVVTTEGSGGNLGNVDPIVEIKRNDIIPEGASYTKADSTVLSVGDSFPEPATGDTYEEGDFIYTYNRGQETYANYGTEWYVTINSNVTDRNQSSYGQIISEIGNKPITNMYGTFMNCKSLISGPAIPSGVTEMCYAFDGCTLLTNAPAIPSNVTNLTGAFSNCKALVNPPDMSNATSVTNMTQAFLSCSALEQAPVIPNGVRIMSQTFYYCKAIVNPPTLPDSVTGLYLTFGGCSSLTSAPKISSNVMNLQKTFANCTSLTGTIEIDADLDVSSDKYYKNCFSGTSQPIVLTGASPNLELLKGTATNNNITIA